MAKNENENENKNKIEENENKLNKGNKMKNTLQLLKAIQDKAKICTYVCMYVHT